MAFIDVLNPYNKNFLDLLFTHIQNDEIDFLYILEQQNLSQSSGLE